jgi:hypothetical protein
MPTKSKTSGLTALKRKLGATKKKPAQAMARLRKTNGKPKRKAPRRPLPKRFIPKEQFAVRQHRDKWQLKWHPWERIEAGRFARYGSGLDGPLEGSTIVILFAENELKGDGSSSGKWRWSVYPKNNLKGYLPDMKENEMAGVSTTPAAAKLRAEQAVGLA